MPNKVQATSFLTGERCEAVRYAMQGETYFIDPEIGRYFITDDAKDKLADIEKRRKIASVISTRNIRGLSVAIIGGSEGRQGGETGLSSISISEGLELYPKKNAILIQEALLNISHRLRHPTDRFHADKRLMWSIFGFDEDSMSDMIELLTEREFIVKKDTSIMGGKVMDVFAVTAVGWDKVDQLQSVSPVKSNDCFVAMSFHEAMKLTFENGIAPAISTCGFRPVRIDKHEHNNKICDEIISAIRASKFVVADFTGHRGGVYYEAGFAHGLGIPVIWTCHQDDFKELHFDTRQYNHISYENPEELAVKLKNRIRATIGNSSK